MRRRRAILVFVLSSVGLVVFALSMPTIIQDSLPIASQEAPAQNTDAMAALDTLEVKGRAPKTGYTRDEFGGGWATVQGCDVRNIILYRDLQNPVLDGECTVVSGTLADPYTGEMIVFSRENSSEVQIDHIVALSDAWQKGAQQLTKAQRKQLANDPLELWAVSGKANQTKSDGDAATWLPSNKAFRCEYVSRQVEIKQKYSLWVTQAEYEAIQSSLSSCNQ